MGYRPGGTIDSFSAWGLETHEIPEATLLDPQSGDFNGDGVPDQAGHFNGEGSGAMEDLWLVLGAGLGTAGRHGYLRYAGTWPAGTQSTVVVGDFNGDGRDDLVTRDTQNWWLLQSQGDRFEPPTSLGSLPLANGQFRWSTVVAADVQGDGRDELLGWNTVAHPDTWEMFSSNGNQWSIATLGGWNAAPVAGFKTVVGDFDGDGRDDLAAQDVNLDWRLLTSIGTALVESATVPDSVLRDNLFVLDYDGDGGDEILAPQTSLIGIDFVTGIYDPIVPLAPGSDFAVGDVNQDGREDLIQHKNSAWVAHSWLGASKQYGARLVPGTFPIANWSWIGLTRQTDVGGPIRAATQAFAEIRNNIEFELYPGYLKGPTATEQTQAGNHWDQAALLKRDLEALGFVVQYAWGTIDPTAEALRNWLGASDDASAVEMLRQAKLYNSNTFVQHAWISAALPSDEAGSAFLKMRDLDPSWKMKNRQPGRETALVDLPYDSTTWTNASIRKSYLLPQNANEFETVSGLLPYEYYEDRLQAWLQNATLSNDRISLAGVPNDGPIVADHVETLPSGLAYPIDGLSTGTAIPNHVVQRIAIGGPGLWTHYVITTATSGLNSYYIEYASGRVRLRQAGSGSVLAESPSLAASAQVNIEIQHFDVDETNGAGPTSPTRTNTYPRKAGEYHALGIHALQHSPESLRALRAKADEAVAGFWNDPSPPGDPGPDHVAAAMNLAMAKYSYELGQAQKIITGLTHKQIILQGVGTGLASSRGKSDPSKPAVEYEFEKRVQVPLVPLAFSIDTKGNLAAAVARKGANPSTWFSSQAMSMLTDTASALEHETLEELFNIDAMSTVKGLQRASAFLGVGSVKIWAGGSVTTFLNGVTLSPALEAELQVDLGQTGARALVLANEIELAATNPADPFDWKGGVFLLENYTLAQPKSKHRIDGGFKGGYGRMSSNFVIPPPSLGQQSVFGDPVNVANGAMYRDETDVSLPNIGVPLEFSRHYESLSSYDPQDSNSGLDVGLGQGWTHSYSDFLTINGAEVTWTDSNGQQHKFTESGGVYINPPDLFGTLVKLSASSFYYQHEDGLRRYFDKSGATPADRGPVLIRIVDRFGRGVRTDYASGRLTAVSEYIDPAPGYGDSSRRIDFIYDSSDPTHIKEVREFGGAGRRWTYTYLTMTPPGGSAKTYLASVALPDDPTRHHEQFSAAPVVQYGYYNAGRIHGLMKHIVEPNGATHSYTYYVNRRSFEVTDAEGHSTYAAYNLYTQATTFFNERGEPETYEYDANGLLKRQTYADRSRDRYEWSNFRMTKWIDSFGNSEIYTYEGSTNRLDTSTDRLGLVTSYDWSSTYPALPAVQTRPGGRTTTYVYADNGKRLDHIQVVADGGAAEVLTTDYLVGPNGLVGAFFTPRGVPSGFTGTIDAYKTDYSYNSAGLPLTERRGGSIFGVSTTYTYDYVNTTARTRGWLLTTTDASDITTTNTYDNIGRLKDTSLPDPVIGTSAPPKTFFVYDTWGQLVEQSDNLTKLARYDYDRKGQRIRATYGDGTFATFAYDPAGNLIAETDELGRVTRHVYDSRNRRVQTIFADGASIGMRYDAEGMLVASIDELGMDSIEQGQRVSTKQYDRGGRLTKETTAKPSQLATLSGGPTPVLLTSLVTTYTYEASTERLYQVTNPSGGYTRLTYDKADRLIREDLYNHGALELVTFHRYDRDGNQVQLRQYDVKGITPPSDWDLFGAANPSRYRRTETAFDNFNRPGVVSETWGTPGDPLEYRYSNTTYTPAGRVDATQTPREYADNRSTTRFYDLAGRLFVLTRPDPLGAGTGLVTQQDYDDAGNLNRVDTLRSPGIYDATVTQRDARYRAVQVTQAYGKPEAAVTQTLFDAAGQVVATIDPLGRMTYQRYDARGRVVRLVEADPDGLPGLLRSPLSLYAYDAAGNLVQEQDAEGRITQYTYDELNRQTRIKRPDPDGAGLLPSLETWTYYDAAGDVDAVLDVKNSGTLSAKPGGGLRYDFDDRGLKTAEEQPDPDAGGTLLAPRTEYVYNGFGELVSETEVRASAAHTTTYTYFRTGWLHTITGAVPQDGEVAPREERLYDHDGNVYLTRTRVNGTTSNDRDLITLHDRYGRVYRREEAANGQFGANAANPITTYSYDYVGNLLITDRYVTSGAQSLSGRVESDYRIVNALGYTDYRWTNDPDGTTSDRPYSGYTVGAGEELLNSTENIDHDLAGQLGSVTDAAGNNTQTTYDNLGRVISEVQASSGLSRTYEYDRVGNRTKAVERDGRWITYQYDAWDRLVLESWFTSGSVLQHTITTAYDEWGRTKSITEVDTAAGDVYGHFVSNLSWEYDHLDRVTKETNTTPVAGTDQALFEYVYDNAGDLVTIRERNFNGTNNFITSVTTLTYDRLHRVRKQHVTPGGFSQHTRQKRAELDYNAAGDLTAVRRIEWNGATEVNFPATSWQYDVWGRPQLVATDPLSTQIAAASVHALGWTRGGRLSSWTYGGAQISPALQTLDYDFRGQLLRAQVFGDWASESWQFDEAGTRRDNDPVSPLTSGAGYVAGDDNEQAASPDWVLTWDAAGRLDKRYRRNANGSQGTLDSAYTWDHRGRLLKVVEYAANGTTVVETAHFAYDARDRRARQTVVGGANARDERYVYENGELGLVYDLLGGGGATAREKLRERYLNARGVDLVLAMEPLILSGANTSAAQASWYLHDHLGTPRDTLRRSSLTGGPTTIQHWQQFRYDVYGVGQGVFAVTAGAPTTAPRIGYTGQVFDVATGLNYYHARYYDANLGRFLSQDPLGFAAGDLNLYRYVGNDPAGLVDPTGMSPARPNQIGANPMSFAGALGYQGAGTGSDRDVLNAVSGLGGVTSSLRGSWVQPGFDQYYSQLESYFDMDYSQSGGIGHAAATRAERQYRQANPTLAKLGDWFGVVTDTTYGAGRGLKTGAKAVVNSGADTIVSTVTFGAVDNTQLWAVNQQDLLNGYDAAYGFGRVGSEILVGTALGGGAGYLAKGGQNAQMFARGITAFDLTSQSVTIARSGQDIADNGLTVSSGLTFAGTALGMGAQLRAGGIRGIDGGPPLGGRYGDVRNSNSGGRVHHMPANSVSPLPTDRGPAILMDQTDHAKTASFGSSRAARQHRAAQRKLIDNGRFRDALQMDIDDIESQFGSKYEVHIMQMLDSIRNLEL